MEGVAKWSCPWFSEVQYPTMSPTFTMQPTSDPTVAPSSNRKMERTLSAADGSGRNISKGGRVGTVLDRLGAAVGNCGAGAGV